MTKITTRESEKESTKQKDNYRVTNWSIYNKALKGRGDISLWIDEQVVKSWYYEGQNTDKKFIQLSGEDATFLAFLINNGIFSMGIEISCLIDLPLSFCASDKSSRVFQILLYCFKF